jgi:DNA-binding NarL/FixJ family response regulator
VTRNLRFDVVLTDLLWNDLDLEYAFDGLDVLDLLERLGRPAPVVLAAQGHGVERDHLDEAAVRPGVAGVVRKATGVEGLVPVLRQVAAGRSLPPIGASPARTSIHAYFGAGRRGETAARLAGAIASGRAVDYDTLAAVAGCSRHTAAKIADKYLGPLIRERAEHPDDLPLTTQVVYRWCGEHSRYLVSWCRRHGHADVLGGGAHR